MAEITCPGCGTVSHLDELRRSASEFCRSCDYPLFWARTATALGGGFGGDDTGLRRLPGAMGRVALADIDCWSCQEQNLVTAVICIRCGADLAGPPAPEAPPAPVMVVPPPPPPPPEPARWWPWIVLAVLFVGGLVALVLVV